MLINFRNTRGRGQSISTADKKMGKNKYLETTDRRSPWACINTLPICKQGDRANSLPGAAQLGAALLGLFLSLLTHLQTAPLIFRLNEYACFTEHSSK